MTALTTSGRLGHKRLDALDTLARTGVMMTVPEVAIDIELANHGARKLLEALHGMGLACKRLGDWETRRGVIAIPMRRAPLYKVTRAGRRRLAAALKRGAVPGVPKCRR